MTLSARRHILLATAALLLLGGCTQSEPLGEDPVKVQQQDVEITFGSYTASSPSTAREATTRAGATGAIDTETALQAAGFSVYCYFTEGETWAENTAHLSSENAVEKAKAVIPNFMYNQYVRWTAPGGTYRWNYFPVKYWPNDNDPADNNSAHGSVTDGHNYLHFFAYAPAVENTLLEGTYTEGDKTWNFPNKDGDFVNVKDPVNLTSGIIALTHNEYNGQPKLKYLWTDKASEMVDLLYDAQKDMYKTKASGEGYVNGNVNFQFKHALSKLEIKVQRIYNHTATADNMGSNEGDTKIFINSLSLTGALKNAGTFNLDDASWTGLTNSEESTTITLSGNDFMSPLSGRPTESDDLTMWELDKFTADGTGVTETAQLLTSSETPLMLIPQSITFTPRITYSFVTKDNGLALSTMTDSQGNKYGRILNNITGSNFTIDLNKGTKYTLLIKIGVESVEFEVVGVEEWDFPIRLNVTSSDYEEGGTTPHTLDEENAPEAQIVTSEIGIGSNKTIKADANNTTFAIRIKNLDSGTPLTAEIADQQDGETATVDKTSATQATIRVTLKPNDSTTEEKTRTVTITGTKDSSAKTTTVTIEQDKAAS